MLQASRGSKLKAEQSCFSFTCQSIGNFHIPRILDQNRMVGKVVNAFDTTINVRTDTNELLVVTLGQVRSAVNFNVSPESSAYSGNIHFKELVSENAEARIVLS